MTPVVVVPLNIDLLPFVQFLRAQGIHHRVLETERGQEIWLQNETDMARVQNAFSQWAKGELVIEESNTTKGVSINGFAGGISGKVLSLSLIILSILLTLYTDAGQSIDRFGQFTIADIVAQNDALYSNGLIPSLEAGELWRLITPIFLHLSLTHLAFNAMWVWVVGSRIETQLGWGTLAMLTLFASVLSNVAQYYDSGPLFGGLSGVVYALFGFAFLWQKWHPYVHLGVSKALMGFVLFWLVLGYTELPQTLGLGSMANTAHLVGLICGVVFAFIYRPIHRITRSG
ncbi:MAG: rhomboid family intramembrane serine protease [Pontibacterium sp.]